MRRSQPRNFKCPESGDPCEEPGCTTKWCIALSIPEKGRVTASFDNGPEQTKESIIRDLIRSNSDKDMWTVCRIIANDPRIQWGAPVDKYRARQYYTWMVRDEHLPGKVLSDRLFPEDR